ncbi:GxxExxY protein [Chryseobacterium bernardetii]
MHQIHKTQTMNYMKLLKVPRSILVNFILMSQTLICIIRNN